MTIEGHIRNTILVAGIKQPKDCATCRYWGGHAVRTSDEKGPCRRRSPTPFKADHPVNDIHAEWPMTAFDDWCGEWEEDTHLTSALSATRG